jgi:hypothetical protein
MTTHQKNRLSPTRPGDRRIRKNGRARARRAAIAKRGPRPQPEIFVACRNKASWKSAYAKAHLRNRKGYVYLCWRDGEEFRTFYLGKAPRKSPTHVDRPGPTSGVLEQLAGELERGAK